MKKNIELKLILDALSRVREIFYDYGKDILDKISEYQTTGTLSGYIGDPSFDYAAFSKVMQGPFYSTSLQLTFESLVYLHYFSSVYDTSLDLMDFISHRRFDQETFYNKAKKHADLSIDLSILKLFVDRSMRNLGISPLSSTKVLKHGNSILDALKIFKHAMSITLHHYGDYDFIVSKIPLGEEHLFDVEMSLNHHIFYTEKPEQIISFAHQAKPGVYIIANVPEGNYADTAFYILFRQRGYAYLVDNSKHSYRDQYYRTKSDGTPGQDAWLDRKYERCYLPVDVVLSFFSKETESKAVSLYDGFDMISLGKITDCDHQVVLYTYAFIDKCFSFFKDNEFASQISNTSCAGFLSQLLNGSTENVPAIASSLLPALCDIDVSWSAEKLEVMDFSSSHMVTESELPVIKTTDLSTLPQGSLTSIEHLKRSAAYRNRLDSANELECLWNNDFKKNYNEVLGSIGTFIKNRGLAFTARKGFKDLTYKLMVSRHDKLVGHKVGDIGYIDTTILSSCDIKNKDERIPDKTYTLSGYTTLHQSYFSAMSPIDRMFFFDYEFVGSKILCNYCGDTFSRYHYILQFLDWEIFKEFFEIKEDELHRIPDQMKRYLNQSSVGYRGNSLLDDIDPIALIQNPWFVASIVRGGEIEFYSRRNPAYFVKFFLCGNCLKSIKKD